MKITVGQLMVFVGVVAIIVVAFFLLRPSIGGHDAKPAASDARKLIFQVTPEPWQSSCTLKVSAPSYGASDTEMSFLGWHAQEKCGEVKFVKSMNEESSLLGLQITHIAEPSLTDENDVACRLVGEGTGGISVFAVFDSSSSKALGTDICDGFVERSKGTASRLSRQSIETLLRIDVRASIPSIVAYSLDHGSYDGISIELLRKNYEPALSHDLTVSGKRGSYCAEATFNGITVSENAASPLRVGTCS